MRNNERYDGIQVLRLVAASLVVLCHATFYTQERLDKSVEVWSLGAIGVDVFFIISGFVMMATSRNFSGQTTEWKKFAVRRLIRIVPMYWIATSVKVAALIIGSQFILHAKLDPFKVFLSYLFLPQINDEGRFEPVLGVGWTLIYEMFFYAIFTLALFLRVSAIKFAGTIFLLCAFISLFRTPDWPAVTMYFHPIVIYFLIGMGLFYLSQKANSRELILIVTGVGIALLIALYVSNGAIQAKGKSLAGFLLATFVVLIAIAGEHYVHGKVPRSLIFLGEASYVLYLFHPLIAPAVPELFSRYWQGPSWLSVTACLVVATIAASFIHQIIERPITRWLRDWASNPHSDSLKTAK